MTATQPTVPTERAVPAVHTAQPNTDFDPSTLRSVFEQHFTYASAVERNTHRFASRTAPWTTASPPANPCPSRSRGRTRWAVWRCFFGAGVSASRTWRRIGRLGAGVGRRGGPYAASRAGLRATGSS